MSETDKPQKKIAPRPENGIPVSVIRLQHPNTISLPGKPAASSISADPQRNKDRYEITYFPQMRHHEVKFLRASQEVAEHTVYLPESWVSWEPA